MPGRRGMQSKLSFEADCVRMELYIHCVWKALPLYCQLVSSLLCLAAMFTLQ